MKLNSQQPLPLVVALGAGRSNEGASSVSTYGIVHSTYMLFDYDGTFFDPELTLRRLKDYLLEDAKYQRVLRNIKAALGLRRGDSLHLPRGGGVVVSGPYRAKFHSASLMGRRIQNYAQLAAGRLRVGHDVRRID